MKSSRLAVAIASAGALLATGACTSVEKSATKATHVSPPSQSVAPSAATGTPSVAASGPATPDPSVTVSAAPTSDISPLSVSPLGGGGQTGLITTKVGQEAKTSKLSVKVSKVVDPVPTDSSSIFKPPAGKRWAAVNLSVTNVGKEKLNFSPMFCVDAKTDKNAKASNAFVTNYGSPMDSGDLQQGDTTVGDVVFEVPSGQKLASVDVRCSLSFEGDQRTIRVDLTK